MQNALATFEDEDERVLKKLGPLIRGRLPGKAWSHVKKMKKAVYTAADGPQRILEILRPHCEEKEQPRVKTHMDRLWKRTVRRIGEATFDFLSRLEVVVQECKDVAESCGEGE